MEKMDMQTNEQMRFSKTPGRMHRQVHSRRVAGAALRLAALPLTALLAAGPGLFRSEETSGAAARAPAAVGRGLNWLQAHQQPDGNWSNPKFPALTALPLWAFALAARPGDTAVVDRAVAFLLSNVRPDGGIYADVPGQKGGGLSCYNTAIALSALHATGRRSLVATIQNARSFIAGTQHLGGDEYRGGFGYDRATGRAYTDLMNTHFAMEAMRRTQAVEDLRPAGQKRVDVDWDAALQYVTRLQNQPTNSDADNAGGFVYNPADPKAGTVTNEAGRVYLRSYGSITYAGLLAMVYAHVPRNDPRVISAVDFASRHWTLAENPGMGQQGLYFYFNVMSRALSAAQVDAVPRGSAPPLAWRDELAARLLELQQPDGSWANPNNRFWESDPVLATAYAVLALEHLNPGR
jgi:squalene-hopene/tetraprenyl-beta-curcumene cyclase